MNSSENKNDYISITYDETRVPKSDYPSQLAAYLTKRFQLKKGARLLDVGCGRGDMLRAFSLLGFDCHAVDKICSAGGNSCQQFNIKTVDIEKDPFPYPDRYFDIIFSKSVIEHIWDPFYLMSEIHRILNDDQICIILTPDWRSQMETFYEDPTHCRPYVPDTLRDLFLMTNFKNVHAELFCQHQFIWHYSFFRYLSFALRLFLSTRNARKLTDFTKIKFFRWSVELMVIGWGYKY